MTDRLTIRRLRRHQARCGKPRSGAPPHGWGTLAVWAVSASGRPCSLPHTLRHIWPIAECHCRAALIAASPLIIGETVFRWRARVLRW